MNGGSRSAASAAGTKIWRGGRRGATACPASLHPILRLLQTAILISTEIEFTDLRIYELTDLRISRCTGDISQCVNPQIRQFVNSSIRKFINSLYGRHSHDH
jgi:hypothetical protein